jgi:hypothetical protein
VCLCQQQRTVPDFATRHAASQLCPRLNASVCCCRGKMHQTLTVPGHLHAEAPGLMQYSYCCCRYCYLHYRSRQACVWWPRYSQLSALTVQSHLHAKAPGDCIKGLMEGHQEGISLSGHLVAVELQPAAQHSTACHSLSTRHTKLRCTSSYCAAVASACPALRATVCLHGAAEDFRF